MYRENGNNKWNFPLCKWLHGSSCDFSRSNILSNKSLTIQACIFATLRQTRKKSFQVSESLIVIKSTKKDNISSFLMLENKEILTKKRGNNQSKPTWKPSVQCDLRREKKLEKMAQFGVGTKATFYGFNQCWVGQRRHLPCTVAKMYWFCSKIRL